MRRRRKQESCAWKVRADFETACFYYNRCKNLQNLPGCAPFFAWKRTDQGKIPAGWKPENPIKNTIDKTLSGR